MMCMFSTPEENCRSWWEEKWEGRASLQREMCRGRILVQQQPKQNIPAQHLLAGFAREGSAEEKKKSLYETCKAEKGLIQTLCSTVQLPVPRMLPGALLAHSGGEGRAPAGAAGALMPRADTTGTHTLALNPGGCKNAGSWPRKPDQVSLEGSPLESEGSAMLREV